MAPRRSSRKRKAVDHSTTSVAADHKDDPEGMAKGPEDIKEAKSMEKQRPQADTSDGTGVKTFMIPYGDKGKDMFCQSYGSEDAHDTPSLLFTHGAGGGISAAAVTGFAGGFASARSVTCIQGTMNLSHRVKCFETVLAHKAGRAAKTLGGRSMGARAAVLAGTAHADEVEALILVSFPLTGDNGSSREDILLAIPPGMDVLFITGDRDKMCKLEELNGVRARMQARSWSLVVHGADHGMSVGGGESATAGLRGESGKMAAKWLLSRDLARAEASTWWDEDEVKAGQWQAEGSVPGKLSAEQVPAKKKRKRRS